MLSISVVSAQQVRFYATADTDKVLLGSTVSVTFTIENNTAGDFEPPSFNYVKQIGGVQQGSRQSYVNGVVSMSKSYTYTLLPNKAGTITIPPARYRVGKNLYQTKALTVKVIEPSDRKDAAVDGDDLIVRLEISDTSLYVGQQAVLEYVLYHQVSVNNFDIGQDLDFEGFYSQVSQYRNRRSKREIINGREYYRNVLKRIYLFPQQQGVYDVGPVDVTLALPSGNRRRTFPLSRSSTYKTVSSNGLTVSVDRLSPKVADQVNGAIGTFRVGATIDSFRLSTDDAATLTLELRGNGDKRNMTAPDLNLGPDWEVFPPSLDYEEENAKGEEITIYQRYKYLLVPQRAGRLAVNPRIRFLDAVRDTVVTAGMEQPFTVMVRQGKRTVTIDDRAIDDVFALSDKVAEGAPYRYRESMFGGWIHHSLIGISLLSIGLLYIGKLRRDKEAGLDPAIKRRKAAAKLSQERLQKASVLVETSGAEYYEVLTQSMYGYVADKYNLSVGSMSMDEVLSTLQADHSWQADRINDLRTILLACQQGLYAGQSQADRKSLYNAAAQLITTVETSIS